MLVGPASFKQIIYMVTLCTCIIPHSEAQTSSCRQRRKSAVSLFLCRARGAQRDRGPSRRTIYLPPASCRRCLVRHFPSLLLSRSCSHQSLCLRCNGRLSVRGEWRLKFYNFNLPVPVPDSVAFHQTHARSEFFTCTRAEVCSSSLHLYLVLMAVSCRVRCLFFV